MLVAKWLAAPSPTLEARPSSRASARERLRLPARALTGEQSLPYTGHGFFKDFTVKDGNIVENHGDHGEISTEVKVQQVVWLATSGKMLPRAYSFTIKNGDSEQSGKNLESWSEIEGIWLPTWWRLSRNEGSSVPVESTLILENVKVEQAGR